MDASPVGQYQVIVQRRLDQGNEQLYHQELGDHHRRVVCCRVYEVYTTSATKDGTVELRTAGPKDPLCSVVVEAESKTAWLEPEIEGLDPGVVDLGAPFLTRTTEDLEEGQKVGTAYPLTEEQQALAEYLQCLDEDAQKVVQRLTRARNSQTDEAGEALGPLAEPGLGLTPAPPLQAFEVKKQTFKELHTGPYDCDPTIVGVPAGAAEDGGNAWVAVVPAKGEGALKEDTGQQYQYPDPHAQEYREMLLAELAKRRENEYKHLPEHIYNELQKVVEDHAGALWVEGAAPGILLDWLFDCELLPNARLPAPHQAVKGSEMCRMQQIHHFSTWLELGHWRKPESPGPCASRVHMVPKPHEKPTVSPKFPQVGAMKWKRPVCDFRRVNKQLRRMAGQMPNIAHIWRKKAAAIFKSLADLLWGFMHMRLTQRAAKLLAVVTEAFGVLEPVVLPFGVANAPVAFQYVGTMEFREMIEEDLLDLFIDDHALGTGVLEDLLKLMRDAGLKTHPVDIDELGTIWRAHTPHGKGGSDLVAALGPTSSVQAKGKYDALCEFLDAQARVHLQALKRVFVIAERAGFKYKFAKVILLQFEITLLGRLVGLGTTFPSREHTAAIREWPRPTRIGDPDSYLGLLAFLRTLMPTQVVTVAEPLRQLLEVRLKKNPPNLKGLMDAVEAFDSTEDLLGYTLTPAAKKLQETTEGPLRLRSGGLPWGEREENAFLTLKRMVVGLTGCYTPDVQGAISGENPYWVLPDACGYGLGAGVMQFNRALVQEKGEELSDYLERFKQLYTQDTVSAAEVQEARNIVERAMLPIAFFSVTLTEAESHWMIWEKELYAIVRVRRAFPDLLNGMHVYVVTDHLNNLVIDGTNALKQPSKILRWSLELAEAMCCTMLFSPGASARIGDSLSRNPPGRDDVRPDLVDDERTTVDSKAVPRSLSAIMELMRKRHQEAHEGRAGADFRQRVNALVSEVMREGMVALGPMHQLASGNEVLALGPLREDVLASGSTVAALYVPHRLELGGWNEAPRVQGTDVQLRCTAFFDPLVGTTTQQWFMETKKARKQELRRQLQDAALQLLRMLSQCRLHAVVATGEGCFPVLTAMSPGLLRDAYVIRRVDGEEIDRLEQALASLQYVVLVAPAAYPPKTRLRTLLEQAPELAQVCPPPGVQIAVVVAEGCPTKNDTERLLSTMTSSVVPYEISYVTFPQRPSFLPPYPDVEVRFRETTVRIVATRGQAKAQLTRFLATFLPPAAHHFLYVDEHDRLLTVVKVLESAPALASVRSLCECVEWSPKAVALPPLLEGAPVRWVAVISSERQVVSERWDYGPDAGPKPMAGELPESATLMTFHFQIADLAVALGPASSQLEMTQLAQRGTPLPAAGRLWSSWEELAREQQAYPFGADLITYLLGSKTKVAEPRRNPGKLRERAQKFHLEHDPPVLIHQSGVPWVPPHPILGERPGMTWRSEVLRLAHDSIHAGHVRGRTLVKKAAEVGWWETMSEQAQKWQNQCALCAAFLRRGNVIARLRSHHGARPFLKLMFDLVEVAPPSKTGARFVLTVICTYSKYVFFRECHDKSANVVAWGLYVIILEAGVCPLVVQSDNGREVHNAIMNELMALLGIAAIQSAPYKPTSEGMIERPHQELRKVMAVALKRLCLKYKDWASVLPIAEYRLRHKPLGETKLTPYAVVHGFFGVCPAQTLTAQFTALDSTHAYDAWIEQLLKDTREVWRILDEANAKATNLSQRYNERAKLEERFAVGDVVYWRKPLPADVARQDLNARDKAAEQKAPTVGRALLPKAEGPLAVYEVVNQHNVYVRDPFTRESVIKDVLSGQPRPVATNQLIKLATTEEELLGIDAATRKIPTPPYYENEVLLLKVGDRRMVVRVVKTQHSTGNLRVQPLKARNQGRLLQRRWLVDGSPTQVDSGSVRARLELDGEDKLTETAGRDYGLALGSTDSDKRVELLSFAHEFTTERQIERFGAKVFDVRTLAKDPDKNVRLKNKDGRNRQLQKAVMEQAGATEFLRQITEAARQGYRVAVGCNKGRHRSVVLVEKAAAVLREEGYSVDARHLGLGNHPF